MNAQSKGPLYIWNSLVIGVHLVQW